jgi:hypothetical protein
MLAPRSFLPLLALVLALVACEDDDEIGTPCESEADCSEALTCDIHEGQGTCQYEHGHRVESPEPDWAAREPAS